MSADEVGMGDCHALTDCLVGCLILCLLPERPGHLARQTLEEFHDDTLEIGIAVKGMYLPGGDEEYGVVRNRIVHKINVMRPLPSTEPYYLVELVDVRWHRAASVLVEEVLHGFDSKEHAAAYLKSEMFTKDVVTGLAPDFQADPEIRIFSVVG